MVIFGQFCDIFQYFGDVLAIFGPKMGIFRPKMGIFFEEKHFSKISTRTIWPRYFTNTILTIPIWFRDHIGSDQYKTNAKKIGKKMDDSRDDNNIASISCRTLVLINNGWYMLVFSVVGSLPGWQNNILL